MKPVPWKFFHTRTYAIVVAVAVCAAYYLVRG